MHTQYQERYPFGNQNHYVTKTCSDDDYNNFLRGQKIVVINSDESITSADLPSDYLNQTEKQFTQEKENYLDALLKFKENNSSHSKISDVNEVIFVSSIDLSSLTFPHKTFQRYCQDNNKFTYLSYL